MANWQGPVTLHGKTDQQAFGDWYFRRGGEHMLLDNSTDPAALCACAGSPFPNTAGSSPLAAAAALADAAGHLLPAALADMASVLIPGLLFLPGLFFLFSLLLLRRKRGASLDAPLLNVK